MKKILFIGSILLILSIGCNTSTKIPKEEKPQKEYLFKELISNGLYLGIPRTKFLELRPNVEYNSDAYDFRSIYVDTNFSERFENVIYYFDNDNQQPLYEFILLLNPDLDADELAREHFGQPNHNNTEWRFPPAKTNLPFTLAAWTYKNKIIIAATISGTEWENGIE